MTDYLHLWHATFLGKELRFTNTQLKFFYLNSHSRGYYWHTNMHEVLIWMTGHINTKKSVKHHIKLPRCITASWFWCPDTHRVSVWTCWKIRNYFATLVPESMQKQPFVNKGIFWLYYVYIVCLYSMNFSQSPFKVSWESASSEGEGWGLLLLQVATNLD